MLSSILAPVAREDQHRLWRCRWLRLAALHSLGNMLAAAATGGVLAVLAWAVVQVPLDLAPWARWGAVLLAVLYLPRQLGWTAYPPLLQSTWQVPRRWAYDYPRWITALLFGLGLGNGCAARIVVPTFYLLFLWPFLLPGPVWILVMWITYGWARSVHVWWLAWTAPGEEFEPRAQRLTIALLERGPWMHRFNALLLAAMAGCLIFLGILA